MRSRVLLGVKRRHQTVMHATKLCCPLDVRQRTAETPLEDAFSIVHMLADLKGHDRWKAGRHVFGGGFSAGTVSIVDLREPVEVLVSGPVQAIQYHVSRAMLDEFADESGARRISTLKHDRSVLDPVVSSLSGLLMSPTAQGGSMNQLFIDQIGIALVAYFATAYGGLQPSQAISGGLAPWQERRARDLLHARLGNQVTIAAIARECGLTPSYFARAFRKTIGQAPHEYLTKLRIEQAKALMQNTELPLVEIALMCGFGDQSYLTRIFARIVGVSPGRWRRAQSS